jgi:hypothetical protein
MSIKVKKSNNLGVEGMCVSLGGLQDVIGVFEYLFVVGIIIG